ncbi:FAD-dependent oxidoreductase [Streptomyces sp. NPDC002431]
MITATDSGGLLDIHEHDGQLALEAAGLTVEFRAAVVEGRQAMCVLAPDGTVLLDKADDGTGTRPEVHRADLRRTLLDSLPDSTVHWGHRAHTVRALGEGRHEVTFADGRTLPTGLLVGADGAWSRVRPLLTPATPEYAGTSFVETYLYEADTRHPAAAKAVGGGMLIAPSPGKEIFAHRESGDTLHTCVALARPQHWFDVIDFTDPATATARIAEEFDGWAPELTALITDGDTAPLLRPHHTLPQGTRWDRVPGVTLLGDAAHLAAPNGEGANLALLDGAELGRALAAHPGDTEAALTAYERDMFHHSSQAPAFDGAEIQEIAHDDNLHALISRMTGKDH